ncbi:MAG: hypothetical protein V1903_05095 [Bacteroidota bacterium]
MMTKTSHAIFIILMTAIVVTAFTVLLIRGISYYQTNKEERAFHNDHELLKPSGTLAHGAGIFGTFFMITGIASYMARKRFRFMSRMGLLKHWLEFHIFLCTLGPVLILFHTAFKFGGIVAVSFWCMVAVFLSGIIGRFIYLQIPRSIEGRELSLNEIRNTRKDIAGIIRSAYNIDDESYNVIISSVSHKSGTYSNNPFLRYLNRRKKYRVALGSVKNVLKNSKLPSKECSKIMSLVRNDIKHNRRIEELDTMQNLFRYWHVIHLPFAMVMLIIMAIHVGVAILFGYHWIF